MRAVWVCVGVGTGVDRESVYRRDFEAADLAVDDIGRAGEEDRVFVAGWFAVSDLDNGAFAIRR